jgi:hypothetical protein
MCKHCLHTIHTRDLACAYVLARFFLFGSLNSTATPAFLPWLYFGGVDGLPKPLCHLAGFCTAQRVALARHGRIDSVRQQLFNDLQFARVRALQWGQRLQMSRLTGCSKFTGSTDSTNDWSCGWQLSTASGSSGSSQVISSTSLDASVQSDFCQNY